MQAGTLPPSVFSPATCARTLGGRSQATACHCFSLTQHPVIAGMYVGQHFDNITMAVQRTHGMCMCMAFTQRARHQLKNHTNNASQESLEAQPPTDDNPGWSEARRCRRSRSAVHSRHARLPAQPSLPRPQPTSAYSPLCHSPPVPNPAPAVKSCGPLLGTCHARGDDPVQQGAHHSLRPLHL